MNVITRTVGLALFTLAFASGCGKQNTEVAEISQPTTEVESENTLPVSERLPTYLNRNIKHEMFYFVMPDRFHNANPENDNGDPAIPISYGGFDPTWEKGFHGGDIAGLEAKLDYLQQMGITAIWMTPILRNKAIQIDGVAHHGYWVVDFTEIDPHFGSNDDLKSLIDAAHQRNIKIFFDIITNHTTDVIKYRECHDEQGNFLDPANPGCPFKTKAQLAAGDAYTPFIPAGEENVKVPAWLNDPAIYNNQGDSTWYGESVITGDFVGLDDINTSLPEVQQNMIDVFKALISDFKPDGFRIDTVKHVDLEFWQVFGPAIIEHAQSIGIPEFFIFGEVYDGNPAVLSTFTTAGKMPSVLDFGFHFNVKDALFTGMDINRIGNLFDQDDFYRDHDSSPLELMNFLGNHDAGRVGMFINQGFPNIDDNERLARSQLGHALMYFSRGIPVVYYGDEQGFTGDAGDIGARENMDPSKVDSYNDNDLIGTDATTAESNFDTTHPLYVTIAELADIRANHPTLAMGEHQNRLVDNERRIYAFSRIDPSDMREYLAVFNLSTQPHTVEIPVDAAEYSLVAGITGKINQQQYTVTLPALSYSLVASNTSIPFATIDAIALTPTYVENDRTFYPVEVSFSDNLAHRAIAVSFYAVSNNGETELLATDYTSPYRLVIHPERADSIDTLQVVARNHNGQEVVVSTNLGETE